MNRAYKQKTKQGNKTVITIQLLQSHQSLCGEKNIHTFFS
jgi:hypothetical protein